MTANDLTLIIAALSGLVGVMAGGAKWLIATVDARNTTAALDQAKAREALSNRLQDEITVLRRDISVLQTKEALYIRRIYQLESFIHRHPGIDIPDMSGWPPL